MPDNPFFLRRIRDVSQAPIPASVQFDLARSSLDDDELDAAIHAFGGPDPMEAGSFGMSDILDDLMERSPRTISVTSIEDYQQRLVNGGYLPSNYPVSGIWDYQSAGASRRLERDSLSNLSQGKNFATMSVGKFMQTLGYAMPTEIIKTLAASVQALPEQAATLAEHGAVTGAAGGAALGASIGAIGGPAGAGAGAIIGGAAGLVTGFVADLLGHSEGESEDGGLDWLDALLPNEWFGEGGARAALQDIGTIATLAPLAGAFGRTAAAAAETRAAVTGMTLGQKLAAGFGDDLAKTTEAGILGKSLTKIFNKVSPDTAATQFIERAAVYTRANPILQGGRSMYAGFSQYSVMAHLAGGLGGEADPQAPQLQGTVWEALGAHVGSTDRQGTPLAEALEDAKAPTTIEMPLLGGDLLDWTVGTMFWPDKLLPGNMGSMAESINAWGTDGHLTPLIDAVENINSHMGAERGRRAALKKVNEILGDDPLGRWNKVTHTEFQFGLKKETELLTKGISSERSLPKKLSDWAVRRSVETGNFLQSESKVLRHLEEQIAAGDHSLARQIMSHHMTYMDDYVAYLESVGIHDTNKFFDASTVIETAEKTALIDTGRIGGATSWEAQRLRARAKEMKEAAQTKFQEADHPRHTPAEKEALVAEATSLVERAGKLTESAKKVQKEIREGIQKVRKGEDRLPTSNVALAKIHDPMNKIPGTATKETLAEWNTELKTLVGDIKKAQVQSKKGNQSNIENLTDELEKFLNDKLARDILKPDEVANVMESIRVWDGVGGKKPPTGFLSARFSGMARHAPKRPASIDPGVEAKLAELGYEAVVRSERVIRPQDLTRLVDEDTVKAVGDYSRKHRGYDTFFRGLTGGLRPDQGGVPIAKMKYAASALELDDVLKIHNLPFTGKRAIDEIANFMKENAGQKTWPQAVTAKRELRQATNQNIIDALRLDHFAPGQEFEIANKIYRGIHRGQALGEEFTINPARMMQIFAHETRMQGLPGIADVMRTAHLPTPKRFKKGHAGYLPEELYQINMLGRYKLNILFDASRRIEQKMMGTFKGELPFLRMWRVKKYMKKLGNDMHGDWVTPYPTFKQALGSGDTTWEHMYRFYDDFVMEKPIMHIVEQLEQKSDALGITNFNPKNWEVAQSWLEYQRLARKHGKDPSTWKQSTLDELRHKVLSMQQYGSKRTGMEKSIHFMLFPFSFQKKMWGGMSDWILSAPYRNMMLQSGLMKYNALSENGENRDFIERYLPAARLLSQLNNFQYGLSPGRFALEGILEDNNLHDGPPRSAISKAAEVATAFFVPGGASTPMHQGVGQGVEAFKWMLTPTFLDEDGAKKLLAAADTMFPVLNDVFGMPYGTGMFQQVPAQITALTKGGSPYWQYRNYDAYLDFYNQMFGEMATDQGYSSKEGLFNSQNGAQFKQMYDGLVNEMGTKFPQGQQFASTIVDETRINRRLIDNLIKAPSRTAAQDELLSMWEVNELAKQVAAQVGIRQDLVQAAIGPTLRGDAIQRASTDREFARLWDKFLAEEYGPIETPG